MFCSKLILLFISYKFDIIIIIINKINDHSISRNFVLFLHTNLILDKDINSKKSRTNNNVSENNGLIENIYFTYLYF